MADAWLLYRQEMTEEAREEIRDLLLTAKVNGFDEFLEVSMAITARIISGEIHPEVAKEARSYLELCLAAITAKALQEGGRKKGLSEVDQRIAEVARKRKALPEPTFEITIDADAEPVRARADVAPDWENA